MDLCLLVLTAVVCGSAPLLAFSSASSLGRDGSPSRGGFLHQPSSRPPCHLPGDSNDIDDNDDDDDGDGASALPGDSTRLSTDSQLGHLLVETSRDRPAAIRWESGSLRGPPRLNLDNRTRPSFRHISGKIAAPYAWTATDSPHHSQSFPDDPQDVDDNDLDDRDDDDDGDDDDGDDESASALPASVVLAAGRADGRRLILTTLGAHSPVRSEAHSLRGPPRPVLADHPFPLGHPFPNHASPFFSPPRGQWLRAPPHSSARITARSEDMDARTGGAERTALRLRSTPCLHQLAMSRARKPIATASRRT
jgi:hypothetical protein